MPDPDKWEQYAVTPGASSQPPATSTPDKWAQFEQKPDADKNPVSGAWYMGGAGAKGGTLNIATAAPAGGLESAISGANKGMDALINTPGQVYHAFKDDPRTPREAKEAARAPGAGHLMLGFNRLITDPMEENLRKGKQDFEAGHPTEGFGHTFAGVVPVAGPFAAHMGEEAGKDPASAVGEGLVYKFAPQIASDAIFKGPARTAPSPAPNVFEGEPPAEIPAGKTVSTRDFSDVPGLLKREATSHIPFAARRGVHKPTWSEWADALSKTKSPDEVPAYGNTANAEMRGPYQPYQGDLKVNPSGDTGVIAPPESKPAPYRLRGNQIQDATTVTPRSQFRPKGLLTTGQPTETALPSGPVPTGEAPAAEVPVTPRSENLDAPHYRSGESVLNQALTSLDNKTLLKVARSRGIDVVKEAQLKPGVADNRIINKIIDDFSQDELNEAAQRGNDAKMHKPVQAEGVSPDAGKEAWHYKVLNTFFPDVQMPKAMAARAQKTIAMRPTGEVPVEGNAATPAVEERGIKAPQKRTFERSTDQGVKDYFSYRFDQLRAEMKGAQAAGDTNAIEDVQRRMNELDSIQRKPGNMKRILTGEEPAEPTTDWSVENMKKQIERNKKARTAKAGD